MPEDMEFEAKIASLHPTTIASGEHPGEAPGLTCPEWSGPVYRIQDCRRYRSRVGHAQPPP